MPERKSESQRDPLQRLAKKIAKRAREGNPQHSYTAQLLADGREKCAKKFGEEAVETALACASGTKGELVGECADALYHMLVMLEVRGVSLAEVYAEVERRMGTSGLAEKAGRRGGR